MQSSVREVNPELVMSLLCREDSLFQRLEELSTRQKELVTQSDMSPLLALLEERRRFSSELAAMARELAPVRRDWTRLRSHLSPSQQEKADGLIDSAGHRLRQLLTADEGDARRLSIRKQTIAQTLRTAGSANRALLAYRSGPERTARLDLTEATP